MSQASAAPTRGAGPRRVLRLGWTTGALAAWSVLRLSQIPLLGGLLLFSLAGPEFPPYLAPLLTFGADLLITVGLAAALLVRLRRVAPGTTGRGRAYTLVTTALLRAVGSAGWAITVSMALTDPTALSLDGALLGDTMPVGQVPELWSSILLVSQAQGTHAFVVFFLAAMSALANIEWGAAIACWFLVSERSRARFWNVFDVFVLVGFTAVTLLLPLQPATDDPSAVTLPAIRLGVTAVAGVRLFFRLVPVALDLVEGSVRLGRVSLPLLGNFRLLVAARLLRSGKSGFLTAIGALSILAVAFSSCTLTTTLSVMGGFRNDLKRKILGNHAHVVIDRPEGNFEGWGPVLDAVRGQPDVVAATPYVEGEVMITSATNLSGGVLRGIDPATIGDVTDLRHNMRHGQIEYLSDPAALLRLRPAEMGRGLLEPPPFDDFPVVDPDDPEVGIRGSVFDDAEDLIEELGPADEESARIRDEIDDFFQQDGAALEEDGDSGGEDDGEPAGADPASDVLPGLIVGQELARTLRLHVGDEVNVVSPLGELGPTGPMPKSRPFRVAGIFYSGMYEFDMKMAYTTLGAAQGFLNVGEAVSGIEVKVEDTENAEAIASALAAAIGRSDLRVRGWQEVNRNLFGALQLEKLAMFITLGIAILVASFCIVGTLTLMVQEKRKEVGILKAMGATGEQIVAVFMAQGLMIGMLGATMGLGLGYLACFVGEHFAIRLNPEVYYIDRLPVHIDSTEFIVTGIASVLVCLLATIYPAILGSRLTPVDALRYG